MKKIIIAGFAIVFSAGILVFSSSAQKAENTSLKNEAEKCAVRSLETAYLESNAIFVGEVLSSEKKGDDKIFKFKVEKYWKGIDEKNVEVSVYESTRFQAWFKTGKKYLVFAYEEDGMLHDTARCSRSKDLENASEDLTKLGEGKSPK
jgi:hypothetical protein